MPSSKEIKYYIFFFLCIVPIFWLDERIMILIKEYRAANTQIDHILHLVGMAAYFAAHGAVIFGGTALIYIIGVFFKKHRVRDLGKTLLIGFAISGISAQIIKHIIGRARPRITYEPLFVGPTLQGSYDSFPSGHTITAFCIAHIFSCFFPKYRILFYLYGAFICCGRVVGGSHFPADVIAGALIGIIIGRGIEKFMPRRYAERSGYNLADESRL